MTIILEYVYQKDIFVKSNFLLHNKYYKFFFTISILTQALLFVILLPFVGALVSTFQLIIYYFYLFLGGIFDNIFKFFF